MLSELRTQKWQNLQINKMLIAPLTYKVGSNSEMTRQPLHIRAVLHLLSELTSTAGPFK